jgi:hypothetical protein
MHSNFKSRSLTKARTIRYFFKYEIFMTKITKVLIGGANIGTVDPGETKGNRGSMDPQLLYDVYAG